MWLRQRNSRPTRQLPGVTPWRRESARRRFRRLILLLLALAISHIAAMVAFEGMTPFDALWLTLTTLTTVGYGDLSAQSVPGRLATVFLLFLGAIWVSFQSAALYFEYRTDRRERMRCGRWKWNMEDHILILSNPDTTVSFLAALLREFRASRRFRPVPIQILAKCYEAGFPEELAQFGAVHYSGEPWDPSALMSANVDKARVIVVLSHDDEDPASDSRTFDVVNRVRDTGTKARILAECVVDANRPRILRAGADIIVRPLRGYPEMIVRALAAPGAEKILEDLFTSQGDECWRYDVSVQDWTWIDLVVCLVKHDIGTPIAYRARNADGIRINPPPNTTVDADKIYVLVREGNGRADAEIAALLRKE